MTIKEFQTSLEQKIRNIKIFSEPLQIAAFSATALMGERIFDMGKDVNNIQLRSPGYVSYSTKPMYVNPDNLYKKTGLGVPMGKPKNGKIRGETKFKTGEKKGEAHKTRYLAGGYKELRNKLGNRTDIVDLNFSDELRMDFSNEKARNQPAEPRKINELEYQIKLDKPINQKKRDGLEKKYGNIFSLSETEKETFFKVIDFEFRKQFAKQT